MIALTRLCDLAVSAASALVVVDDLIVVAADDELELAIHSLDSFDLVSRLRLFAGELPRDAAERKRAKPDIEALLVLPDGRVLALGSGSTPARMRGALVALTGDQSVTTLDLSPLYARLGADIPELNIEGAAICGDTMHLFQRGNGAARFNAIIDLDLGKALASLADRRTLDPSALDAVHPIDIGLLSGVALAFTDACALGDGRMVFTAAAEDSPDTYHDGPTAGSAVGILDSELAITRLEPIDLDLKLEGVHASIASDAVIDLLLTADADDPAATAPLLAARL